MKMISLTDQIVDNVGRDYIKRKKPEWLRAKIPGGKNYAKIKKNMDDHNLHTVCQSARCPNMGECWDRGTATIMILGDICTRSCGFCNVNTGRPPIYDTDEPRRVADSVALMGLKHIVITSVNRDERLDGGAAIWAETIRRIRETSPKTSIEVLIPDFCGNWDALQLVIDAKPEILGHNIESVKRLYKVVRPQANYQQTIELLKRCKDQGLRTKTGIMVGIGEEDDEVEELMHDVVDGSACDILTVGQYLQPTKNHLPISKWVTPDQFKHYKKIGEAIGFGHVESGPLVRSSYHAEEQVVAFERGE